MTSRVWLPILLLAGLVASACTPAVSSSRDAAERLAGAPARDRTLVIVTRIEPPTIGPANIGAGTNSAAKALFSAGLTDADERGVAEPRLAQSVPQLNTESWRVFADGRMETTFTLRAGLTWHDGTPLSAEDFVFGWRLRRIPDLGLFSASATERLKSEVLAPDARTLVVRWSAPHPDAATSGATAMPRHILEEPLEQLSRDAFANHPWWTREYVGLGPYRLERWEPGAFIEGVAFDGYALGRPKVGRAKLVWIGDPNTVVANLLSGEAHVALDDALRFQSAMTLKREWDQRNEGVVILSPTEARYVQVQFRPELANPRSVLDLRVRKALIHAVDRQPLADALLEGHGRVADTMVSPQAHYFAAIDTAVAKYRYDLRRTEQLMAEAGFSRGAGGVYTNPSEGPFSAELRASSGSQEEQEHLILLDNWRRAGMDISSHLLSPAQQQAGEVRSTFPALAQTVTGLGSLAKFISGRIPSAGNRWVGSNRGGYSNPEYDRLYEAYNSTLEPEQRVQHLVDLMKIVGEDLPGLFLYYTVEVVAHASTLSGPVPPLPERDGSPYGNIHQWEWR